MIPRAFFQSFDIPEPVHEHRFHPTRRWRMLVIFQPLNIHPHLSCASFAYFGFSSIITARHPFRLAI